MRQILDRASRAGPLAVSEAAGDWRSFLKQHEIETLVRTITQLAPFAKLKTRQWVYLLPIVLHSMPAILCTIQGMFHDAIDPMGQYVGNILC